MTTVTQRKLFTSVEIGPIALGHRVVMAPLTRSRSAQPGDVPGDLMLDTDLYLVMPIREWNEK